MKKPLLLLLLCNSLYAPAQTQFDRILNIAVNEGGNSLRFPWAGGINFPWMSPIDLNGDGRNDIFLFDHQNNRILTFINNGNTSAGLAWDYSPAYALQFPPVNKWVFLYDYDCDGKADFFTLSSALACSGIAVYKNISTSGSLQWTIVDSCLKEQYITFHLNVYANSISLPHFNDIDGDGDMDILGYNTLPDGRILYHRNMSIEHYGICDSLDFNLESLCWGNFQLKSGSTNTVGCFQCPCRFGVPLEVYHDGSYETDFPYLFPVDPVSEQSAAAKRDDTVSSIFTLDLDNDGYKELLVGDISSTNTLMVHNTSTGMDYQDTLYPSANNNTPALFNGFHYHAFIDVDNDGLNDLLLMPYDHENKNGIWLYKNSGTNTAPVFNLTSKNFLQNQMIDVGEDACPVLFDYDGDNLPDLVISKAIFDTLNGSYKTGLYLYKNTGTTVAPVFDLITDDFGGLTALGLYVSPTYPAFGDLDGDCDQDMIIGMEDGHLHYYENTAGCGNPATFTGPVVNYMGIDVGKYATPQLYDLNHDGLLDIICGAQRGFINYFKNRGTVTAPIFDAIPTSDTLGCIVIQGIGTTDGYTVPFFYDSLGSTRLLVANENGNVYQYNNIDGNLTGCFNNTGMIYHPSESNRVKFNITVSGGDLNGDSLTDIVIGQSTGGVDVFYQHNPNSSIKETGEIKPTFEVFPNPAGNEMFIHFYHIDHRSSIVRIFNSIGELITDKVIKDEIAELNTSSWPGGIYFIQLTTGRFSMGRKIIVNH